MHSVQNREGWREAWCQSPGCILLMALKRVQSVNDEWHVIWYFYFILHCFVCPLRNCAHAAEHPELIEQFNCGSFYSEKQHNFIHHRFIRTCFKHRCSTTIIKSNQTFKFGYGIKKTKTHTVNVLQEHRRQLQSRHWKEQSPSFTSNVRNSNGSVC